MNALSSTPHVRLRPLAILLFSFAWLLQAAFAAPLPRATPESQGLSSTRLLELVDALDGKIEEMHSLMILRHGKVVAEGWWAPYGAEHNHVLFSLSKSFTSTAVGLAVAEGKLSIDDEVLKFFPEDAPASPSANLKAMRVRDLLTMSTGHQDEPPRSAAEMSAKSFLAHPVPHKPGTHFKYNTPATFMQSAIVQRVTGQTVLDYLKPRLFAPLGIEKPVWDTNFQGISLGGYGLRVRTEDIAKFGQLYLQKGRWADKQLVPFEWVDLATSRQMSNGSNPQSDWEQGYGFQFWRCRHKAFRGDGAFGQFCVVLPDQDVVVAITSGGRDLQGVLSILWEKLLPALNAKGLEADKEASARLAKRLKGLSLRRIEGAPGTPLSASILGKTYMLDRNPLQLDSVAVKAGATSDQLQLTITTKEGETTIPCGHPEWIRGKAMIEAGSLAAPAPEPVASHYAWTAEDTLVIKIAAYETPFVKTVRMKFSGDTVAVDMQQNVSFGPTKSPTIKGKQQR